MDLLILLSWTPDQVSNMKDEMISGLHFFDSNIGGLCELFKLFMVPEHRLFQQKTNFNGKNILMYVIWNQESKNRVPLPNQHFWFTNLL